MKREKKKLFKNKWQMIIYIIIFILCIIAFILIGTHDYSPNKESDAIRFSKEFNMVENDNIYKYATSNDVLNIIQGRTGIVLMGFPENKWTNYIAKYLNDVAKELEITEIYYYNFLRDRENNNGTYETIINRISDFVPTNDLGVQNIDAPTILIVKNGHIILYNDETAIIHGNITPDIYYNDYQIMITKNDLKDVLLEYKGE